MSTDATRNEQSLIALFESHAEVDQAISKLKQSGYDIQKISIIALNLCAVENVKGYYGVIDRMKKWGEIGAFYGGFWGLLFGAMTFFIPGIGPILIGGPVAALIVALEGAVALGTVSALGAALVSIGIPESQVLKYETEIKAGKYMLLAQGSPEQMDSARAILDIHLPKEASSAKDWELNAKQAKAITSDPDSIRTGEL